MMRAQELATELDISMRTFYRRLNAGEIEGVDTISGRRYQVADSARPLPAEPQASAIRRQPQAPPIIQVTENTRLEARVVQLEGEVAQLKRRVDALLEWSELAEKRLNKPKRSIL